MADVTEIKELLALTEELTRRAPTDAERKRLEHATAGVPEEQRATRACPHCGLTVEVFDAAHHFRQCRHAPARRRYQTVVAIARTLAGEALTGPLAELASLNFDPLDGLLTLARGRLSTHLDWLADSNLRREAVESVRPSLLVQLHAADRATDPCPWCGGVFDVAAFFEHLSTGTACALTSHAEALSDALRERFGEEGFVAVRQTMLRDFAPAKQALEVFLAACSAYQSEFGFEGDERYRWYSKSYAEQPWRAAFDAAAAWLNEEKKTPTPSRVPMRELFMEVLDVSRTFWNTMGDGERGKSLITAENCSVWETVNAAAGRYLASFERYIIAPAPGI